MVLLRGWYAFLAVGVFVYLGIIYLVSCFQSCKKNRTDACTRLFVAGLSAVCSFFLDATPVAIEMLTSRYSDLFSAYKTVPSFGEALLLTAAHLGFHTIQNLHAHQYYMLIPAIVVLSSVSVTAFLKIVPPPLVFLTLTLFGVANSHQVFVPNSPRVSYLFSNARVHPLVRNDLAKLKRLFDSLESTVAAESGDIYVLATSEVVNDDVIRNGCRDLGNYHFCNRILGTHHLDKRDGFPNSFLSARYIITPDKVSHHLKEENQQLVKLLIEALSALSPSLVEFEAHFALEDGRTLRVLEKQSTYPREVFNHIEAAFTQRYPEHTSKCRVLPCCEWLISTSPATDGGAVRFLDEGTRCSLRNAARRTSNRPQLVRSRAHSSRGSSQGRAAERCAVLNALHRGVGLL